jgi:hypothetical protein
MREKLVASEHERGKLREELGAAREEVATNAAALEAACADLGAAEAARAAAVAEKHEEVERCMIPHGPLQGPPLGHQHCLAFVSTLHAPSVCTGGLSLRMAHLVVMTIVSPLTLHSCHGATSPVHPPPPPP